MLKNKTNQHFYLCWLADYALYISSQSISGTSFPFLNSTQNEPFTNLTALFFKATPFFQSLSVIISYFDTSKIVYLYAVLSILVD